MSVGVSMVVRILSGGDWLVVRDFFFFLVILVVSELVLVAEFCRRC